MIVATRGAGQIGLAPGVEFGNESRPAVMAEPGPVADASQAVRANGVEIALVQREAGMAIRAAAHILIAPSGAARGTANGAGLVPLRLLDRDDLAAVAAKAAANRPLGRVVLPSALRAFDEETHGQDPGEYEGDLILHQFRGDGMGSPYTPAGSITTIPGGNADSRAKCVWLKVSRRGTP
jgi:hypothetical protein